IGSLGASTSFEYDCTLDNVQDDFTNSATATGHPPVGDDVTATDTADVDVIHPEITITKATSTPAILTGGTAAFTITVKNTGAVPLTGVQVTDAQAAGCARTPAQIAAIPPHSSSTFDPGDSVSYSCTVSGVTSSFTNSATATGTPPVGD